MKRFIKLLFNFVLTTAILIVSATGITTFAGGQAYFNDFSTDSSGGGSLKMYGGTTNQILSNVFEGQSVQTGMFRIGFDVKWNSENGPKWISLVPDGLGSETNEEKAGACLLIGGGANLRFSTTNRIGGFSGDSEPYSPGEKEWTRIEIIIDFDAEKPQISYYTDGVFWGTGQINQNIIENGFRGLFMATNIAGGIWEIDNLVMEVADEKLLASLNLKNQSITDNGPGDSEKTNVAWSAVSDWALPTVEESVRTGIYPTILENEDLTRSITRREFAHIAVSVFESMDMDLALSETNPFYDTKDNAVLKMYNAGIIYGKATDRFAPMDNISREEVAVILERICKKAANDGKMKSLSNSEITVFADDGDISHWARESVYLMASNGIMGGIGDNCFAPRNITTKQEESGYANTSIEQALTLMIRVYKLSLK